MPKLRFSISMRNSVTSRRNIGNGSGAFGLGAEEVCMKG